MPSLTSEEQQKFQKLIEEHSGIIVASDKAYLIETRLEKMLEENDCKTFDDLHNKIILGGKNNPILTKLIDQMTTNETLWFRDNNPFLAIENIILPEFVEKALKNNSPIRIWSAAASSGQEAYTIAMIFQEYARKQNLTHILPRLVEIKATDICSKVLEQAKEGIYDNFALSRGLSEELKTRYFKPLENNKWQLDDTIRAMVQFQQFNLKESYSILGQFDLILMRNVLIYFNDSFKKDILERAAVHLKPEGYFFVGATEIITNITSIYKVAPNSDRSAFYQRADAPVKLQQVDAVAAVS